MIHRKHVDVAFVCDAGTRIGAGHVMRSLALAEEFSERNLRVAYFADLEELTWVQQEVLKRVPQLFPRSSERELMDSLGDVAPDFVVFDSYTLSSDFLHAARGKWRTLAMVDGAAGLPEADVVVDQNLGAEDVGHHTQRAKLLAGAKYALIRDEILVHRPTKSPSGEVEVGRTLRVLIVMGGTDPLGVTSAIIDLVASTGVRCDITAISSGSRMVSASLASLAPSQTLRVVAPGPSFPKLVCTSDIVISAAGSATWELFALGACAALVVVADNQTTGYDAAVRGGLAVGLGLADGLNQSEHRDQGGATLSKLFGDAVVRSRIRKKAWQGVDGRGKRRIADVLIGVQS